ncbi:hypothetical protein GCQ56_19935 [Marinifilum sp. N1E240]|uniref:hypothetical protein n=1 Tax=Marinifilum sp. N1E240 TaxID=2608082 RepID=UPI00128D3042|nr:hypothetical protein [Marinifilum sp. N1E240]MPQ49277.1 hypothetical protein [Marinifilum sp. N1E240]
MTRIVPFDPTYEVIRKIEKAAFALLIVSASIIAINWSLTKYLDASILNNYLGLLDVGKTISYVSMVGYILMSLLARILFQSVEKKKRNDLIDNSFGTTYCDENSTGYYNNEEINNGIKKLALNSYESSFHTENTLKRMIYKNLIILVVLSVPFLLSIFSVSGSNIVRLLFEISIPLIMISQFIVLIIYYLYVLSINERFKIELTNIGSREIVESDIPKLLIPIMEYYNTKSWANTNLDSKIFNKYNASVSQNWERRKATFN